MIAGHVVVGLEQAIFAGLNIAGECQTLVAQFAADVGTQFVPSAANVGCRRRLRWRALQVVRQSIDEAFAGAGYRDEDRFQLRIGDFIGARTYAQDWIQNTPERPKSLVNLSDHVYTSILLYIYSTSDRFVIRQSAPD